MEAEGSVEGQPKCRTGFGRPAAASALTKQIGALGGSVLSRSTGQLKRLEVTFDSAEYTTTFIRSG